MTTTDAGGTKTGDFMYDPFGEVIGTTRPDNTGVFGSFGWVGQHEKFSETHLKLTPVQMGERVYIPSLGRFMQVDGVEGGVENNYVYPPDAVNDFDLEGTFSWGSTIKLVTRVASVASMLPGPVGMAASAVAVAGNLAQGNYKGALVAGAGLIGLGAVAGAIKLASKAGLGTKLASFAWTKGRAGSPKANLLYHFNKHGKSLGYGSPLSYTLGAYRDAAKSVVRHVYRNGKVATMSKNLRLTVRSKGKLVTYFKPNLPTNYWIKNVKGR